MSFEFAAVARNSTILAQYAISSGNPDVIATEILQGIKEDDSKEILERGKSRYFVLHEKGGLNYIISGPSSIQREAAFNLLTNIQRSFILTYNTKWKDATLYSLQQDFSPTLKAFIDCNSLSKTEQIKQNLVEAQEAMYDSFEQALTRGEQLEDMEAKSLNLLTNATEYGRKASELKRKLCWEKYRYYIFAGILILFLVIIIVIVSCGGFSFKDCK